MQPGSDPVSSWKELNQRIVACQQCPRLIDHCRDVAREKRKAFRDETYWGKPVPNVGRSKVPLLIVGLAPAAHGANRTGRMFTGDRSGDFLYRALHEAGFCNQPDSKCRKDGLRLQQCAITSVCHCAPPANKPTGEEIDRCQPFLQQTIELCQPRVFLALGGLAFRALKHHAVSQGWLGRPGSRFGHAVEIELPGLKHGPAEKRWLIGSYHPSQQNTFTGRLTRDMFSRLFERVRQRLGEGERA